ncbi:MAG: DUF3971 domain-containing protein, partial [Rhodospirillaceae bacterium]
SLSARASGLNTEPDIQVDARLSELSIETLREFWPVNTKPNTRSWIDKNLADGKLTDTAATIRLAGANFDEIDVETVALTSTLEGMTVQYIEGLPKAHDAAGVMTVGLDEVIIDLGGGHLPDARSIRGLRITGGTLRMYDLGDRGSELADFDIEMAGDFGTAMRLIDYEPLNYASRMGMDAQGAIGSAEVSLALD